MPRPAAFGGILSATVERDGVSGGIRNWPPIRHFRRKMNKPLLHLMAFWSAWFISSQGRVIITAGLRQKLIELLELQPSSMKGVIELRKQATLLAESESVGADHPLNRAMFVFLVEHEEEFPNEFQANVNNIKDFFLKR